MTVWKSPPSALHSLSITASISEPDSWQPLVGYSPGSSLNKLLSSARWAVKSTARPPPERLPGGKESENGSFTTADVTLYRRLPWQKCNHVSLGRLALKSLSLVFCTQEEIKAVNMAEWPPPKKQQQQTKNGSWSATAPFRSPYVVTSAVHRARDVERLRVRVSDSHRSHAPFFNSVSPRLSLLNRFFQAWAYWTTRRLNHWIISIELNRIPPKKD